MSGAAGVMAGTANVVPAEIVAVYDAVQAGDLDAARQAWARIYPLLDAALSVNFIAAVKVGLNAVGFPAGPTREPVLPLAPEDDIRITNLASVFRPQTVS